MEDKLKFVSEKILWRTDFLLMVVKEFLISKKSAKYHIFMKYSVFKSIKDEISSKRYFSSKF